MRIIPSRQTLKHSILRDTLYSETSRCLVCSVGPVFYLGHTFPEEGPVFRVYFSTVPVAPFVCTRETDRHVESKIFVLPRLSREYVVGCVLLSVSLVNQTTKGSKGQETQDGRRTEEKRSNGIVYPFLRGTSVVRVYVVLYPLGVVG